MKPLYPVLICSLLSASCATTDDPNQGGLAGGVHGLSSGAYEKRIEEREESLERLEGMQKELRTEQQGLEMDKAEHQARLRDIQTRLARLDRETERLMQDIRNKRLYLAEEKAKQARLEQNLARLRGDIADLEQKSASGGSMVSLETERDRLEEEYRLLLDLYLELGK